MSLSPHLLVRTVLTSEDSPSVSVELWISTGWFNRPHTFHFIVKDDAISDWEVWMTFSTRLTYWAHRQHVRTPHPFTLAYPNYAATVERYELLSFTRSKGENLPFGRTKA